MPQSGRVRGGSRWGAPCLERPEAGESGPTDGASDHSRRPRAKVRVQILFSRFLECCHASYSLGMLNIHPDAPIISMRQLLVTHPGIRGCW